MPKWLRHTFIIAFLLSILLHVLVATFVFFFRIPMPHDLTPDAIEVFDAKGMQVTDQLVPGNRQIPKQAQHIGVDDNAVTEQTVARPERARPQQQARSRPQSQVEEQREQIPKAPKQRQERITASKLPFTKDSLYAIDPNLFAMKQPTKQKLDNNLESVAPRKRSTPRTAVSSTMNVESQAYLSEDYYPNYNFGAHTYVNVLRYPDVEYFVRLKRAFKQTWNPVPAVQQYFASGGAKANSIAVVLAVSVDPSGNMSELFVLKSSGSGQYDQEALRTVRANAPFSAPPQNILKNNLLRMSWTFVVYL